jgi:hypothetical protein
MDAGDSLVVLGTNDQLRDLARHAGTAAQTVRH